ncbi:MAG: DUF4369 domain-containing protein [Prevotella sp.]|nr:DUF4369 domain-containing protein [Prevotella sp.]
MRKPRYHKHLFQGLRYSFTSHLSPLTSLLFLLTSSIFLLTSCGPDRGTFRMEGEFKSFNQGELYVYSPDGGIRKVDTVGVKGGRFTYQIALDSTATFILVFPNYSEIPVIGASGAQVEIEGDASHLKEIEVRGTKENELLTGFRLKVSEMTPPETIKEAADFITKHPDALASAFLLNKYFVQSPSPDNKQTLSLAQAILKVRPGDKRIAALVRHLEGLQAVRDGAMLPKFTAIDIKGHPISNGDLYAPVNVITTWSSWNYESQNIQRQLKRREKEKGVSRLRIVSICLDADAKECRRLMDRDSITWCNICDERMWNNPILTTLGLSRIPDNIITNSQGRILAHSLPVAELNKKIDELLK